MKLRSIGDIYFVIGSVIATLQKFEKFGRANHIGLGFRKLLTLRKRDRPGDAGQFTTETGTPIPKAPPLFSKFWNSLNHHRGTIELPTVVDREFDYETEQVIVIGQRSRNVSEKDALDIVAGYATGNDVSARGLQNITSQFMAGKMSDGFAPLGPWLATRDLVPDPNNLRLQTHVNGEVRQDWNTRDMIFGCRKIISYVSSTMTLKPGDIIFTGTPQGVIWAKKSHAKNASGSKRVTKSCRQSRAWESYK